MKILQIAQRIPFPPDDGGALATYNLTKYLHLLGHEITFLCLNTNKHFQNPDVMQSVCNQIIAVPINTDLKPFDALKSFLFSSLPYNLERFFSHEMELKIEEVLKNNQFDIIHFEGIYMMIYEKIVRKYAPKTPIVIRSHNVEAEIWNRLQENESNFIKRFYLKHLANRIKTFEINTLPKANGIIAITQKDANAFKELGYKGKLTSIPAGIEVKKNNSKPQDNTLVFLGSLEWLPNIQGLEWFLNSIWPEINKKYPSTTLHIGGKNPSSEILNWKYPNVTIHGQVPDAQEFVSNYKIVIVPLLSGSGMRLKIIEAFACEKCVISTSIGIEGILAEHQKDFWQANTKDEWIQGISFLLENPEKIDEIAKNGYQIAVNQFDWQNIAKQYESFYSELIADFI